MVFRMPKPLRDGFSPTLTALLSIVDETEALDLAWPLLTRHINGGVFTKFDKTEGA